MIDPDKLEIGEHYDLMFMGSRFTARCVLLQPYNREPMKGFWLSIPIEQPPRFIEASDIEQARRIPKPRVYDSNLQKVKP